ncbi:nuclear autoantigenic sperm protein-like [Otolemur garnettii]|uniref:nuclear autoantigenic sperm protein-like n=1 Tax=Otolemur garnettii TaxID=30611 RepID=UPI000C7F563F|nr:nuclear autoantigenic sperm protein-like [Otolemur garnettii]
MATESTATAAIAAELASARVEEGVPVPSTSTDKVESLDVDSEADKLLGLGQKHLVMGDIPAAVNAFQEAANLFCRCFSWPRLGPNPPALMCMTGTLTTVLGAPSQKVCIVMNAV